MLKRLFFGSIALIVLGLAIYVWNEAGTSPTIIGAALVALGIIGLVLCGLLFFAQRDVRSVLRD